MTVCAIYTCDGCGAVSDPVRLGRRFESVTGRPYGFGCYVHDKHEDAAPDGWIAYDLIGCTYCPECWNEIQRGSDESALAKATGND